MTTTKREIWSFFSGAMGLDLGFEEAGLTPTLLNEIDSKCSETIAHNRPSTDLVDIGIEYLSASRLRKIRSFAGDVFLMIGGPPCQSFCSGGKRAALSDPRGNLIYEYLRLVDEVRPQYFVLENIANLTTAALRHRPIKDRPGQHWSLKRYDSEWAEGEEGRPPLGDDEKSGSAIRQILTDVQTLGYHVTFGVLDAADYGAPQHRMRFVMIGSRDLPPPALPTATHGYPESGLRPYRTVRDVIYGLRSDPGPGSLYTERTRSFFDMVPEGGNWRSLPKEIQKEALGGSAAAGGGKTGFYRRLAWDRPSPTIIGRANRKGSAFCHPEESRPLSVREFAALQGFPDDWDFRGAINTQYMQIGNAVPVQLGIAISRSIKEHKNQKDDEWSGDFEEMLDTAIRRLRATAKNKHPSRAGVA